MQNEMKNRIITWTKANENSYRQEIGAEYRYYLIEDAIGEFGSWDDSDEAESLRETIANTVRQVLEGDL